jgi:hypothetical protein
MQRQHTPAYVSMRQHTSAYASIRQHTSTYTSIRQRTPAYVSPPPARGLRGFEGRGRRQRGVPWQQAKKNKKTKNHKKNLQHAALEDAEAEEDGSAVFPGSRRAVVAVKRLQAIYASAFVLLY